MLVKIVAAVVIVVIVLAVVVALQPAAFRVERRARIAAPPATVFAQIDDLRKWPAWSPWDKLDPAMRKTYDGPSGGAGAAFTWSGNREVGEGRVTIVESRPNERVRIRLDMLKPMSASNDVEFTLTPDGDGTMVVWSMTGRKGFIAKAFGLVMNMDRMVGGQFDQGLASLRSVTEGKKS